MSRNADHIPMVPVVDHIGIAVPSLEEATRRYAAILGLETAGEETVASEGVRVAFFGDGPGRLELLEPIDPESSVARFLVRRGAGLHHICLRVSDVEDAVSRALEAGVELIPPGLRRGAGGRSVAFLHPRGTGGVLVELTESGDGA